MQVLGSLSLTGFSFVSLYTTPKKKRSLSKRPSKNDRTSLKKALRRGIAIIAFILPLPASESGSGPREMKSTCRSGHKSDPASACVMTAQAKTAGVVLQTALGQKVYGT